MEKKEIPKIDLAKSSNYLVNRYESQQFSCTVYKLMKISNRYYATSLKSNITNVNMNMKTKVKYNVNICDSFYNFRSLVESW